MNESSTFHLGTGTMDFSQQLCTLLVIALLVPGVKLLFQFLIILKQLIARFRGQLITRGVITARNRFNLEIFAEHLHNMKRN